MQSLNPATGEIVWEGKETTPKEADNAIESARKAFKDWKKTSLQERIDLLEKYGKSLEEEREALAEVISQEVGKPLWESKGEVTSMIQKIRISIEVYLEKYQEREITQNSHKLFVSFRPHGVVAVLGPFNFPGHLPNGHIVPALLAGNTVVFKPSEKTPGVGEKMMNCLKKAGFHQGQIQLLQGGGELGRYLALHSGIDGLFFTGSFKTGRFLSECFAKNPEKILALEMGGNNPLVISMVSDLQAAVYLAIQSAFLTSGQRCSAARRLILPNTSSRQPFINALIEQIQKIRVGAYTERPEPFMGPLIDEEAARNILRAEKELINRGAIPLIPLKKLGTFVSPALLDVTPLRDRPDEEFFGPLLQVIFVNTFADAILEANRTEFGLTAALFSSSEDEWDTFYSEVRAGVINWNSPTTGASSRAPFGGVGKSGNHRPSASLAANYCSYPVSSMQINHLKLPSNLPPGIN